MQSPFCLLTPLRIVRPFNGGHTGRRGGLPAVLPGNRGGPTEGEQQGQVLLEHGPRGGRRRVSRNADRIGIQYCRSVVLYILVENNRTLDHLYDIRYFLSPMKVEGKQLQPPSTRVKCTAPLSS